MSNTEKMKKDVAVIMGSQSDYSTMVHAVNLLKELEISHDVFIISAHRTPESLFSFAKSAQEKGFKVIIAGAGGAAQLYWYGCIAYLFTCYRRPYAQ